MRRGSMVPCVGSDSFINYDYIPTPPPEGQFERADSRPKKTLFRFFARVQLILTVSLTSHTHGESDAGAGPRLDVAPSGASECPGGRCPPGALPYRPGRTTALMRRTAPRSQAEQSWRSNQTRSNERQAHLLRQARRRLTHLRLARRQFEGNWSRVRRVPGTLLAMLEMRGNPRSRSAHPSAPEGSASPVVQRAPPTPSRSRS